MFNAQLARASQQLSTPSGRQLIYDNSSPLRRVSAAVAGDCHCRLEGEGKQACYHCIRLYTRKQRTDYVDLHGTHGVRHNSCEFMATSLF